MFLKVLVAFAFVVTVCQTTCIPNDGLFEDLDTPYKEEDQFKYLKGDVEECKDDIDDDNRLSLYDWLFPDEATAVRPKPKPKPKPAPKKPEFQPGKLYNGKFDWVHNGVHFHAEQGKDGTVVKLNFRDH